MPCNAHALAAPHGFGKRLKAQELREKEKGSHYESPSSSAHLGTVTELLEDILSIAFLPSKPAQPGSRDRVQGAGRRSMAGKAVVVIETTFT